MAGGAKRYITSASSHRLNLPWPRPATPCASCRGGSAGVGAGERSGAGPGSGAERSGARPALPERRSLCRAPARAAAAAARSGFVPLQRSGRVQRSGRCPALGSPCIALCARSMSRIGGCLGREEKSFSC